MWHTNKTVSRVYTTHDDQNAWANIAGLGWRRIKTGDKDGVTNTFVLLSGAKANNRTVNVYIVSDLIERAYMN
ncbi:hypothetical protein [Coralliovum pocilloporae]|uniref:hypothetical protein n=1 Tax=Coralliovum pocilloporae TaxID=3066369 RepID=UPI003306CB0A